MRVGLEALLHLQRQFEHAPARRMSVQPVANQIRTSLRTGIIA